MVLIRNRYGLRQSNLNVSPMFRERLNKLMVLYVHKNKLDRLDLTRVVQGFINGSESRMSFFLASDTA